MPVESGLHSALNRHTVRPFTQSYDTRGCNNTICPPEDEQGTARNMLRIIMLHIYCYRIKEVSSNNTICPPEDEQGTVRNMLRIIM